MSTGCNVGSQADCGKKHGRNPSFLLPRRCLGIIIGSKPRQRVVRRNIPSARHCQAYCRFIFSIRANGFRRVLPIRQEAGLSFAIVIRRHLHAAALPMKISNARVTVFVFVRKKFHEAMCATLAGVLSVCLVHQGDSSITEVTWFLLGDSSTLRFQLDLQAPAWQGLKSGTINAGLTGNIYSRSGPFGHLM